MKKTPFLLLLAAMMLTSCDQGQNQNQNENPGGGDIVDTYGENLALNKKTKDSSSYDESHNSAKLLDGDKTDTRWSPLDGEETSWAWIDLGESKKFNTIVLAEWLDTGWSCGYKGYRCNSFVIEYADSVDGVWNECYRGTSIGKKAEIKLAKDVTAKFVRLTLLGTNANKNGKALPASIYEIEVYNLLSK